MPRKIRVLPPEKAGLEFLFDFLLTRTFVRVMILPEQKFEKEEASCMTGWTFFFMLVGVAVLTAQLFRIVDAIERPSRRRRRHSARVG